MMDLGERRVPLHALSHAIELAVNPYDEVGRPWIKNQVSKQREPKSLCPFSPGLLPASRPWCRQAPIEHSRLLVR